MPTTLKEKGVRVSFSKLCFNIALLLSLPAVLYLGFMFFNGFFAFIYYGNHPDILNYLNFIRDIAALTVIGLLGLSFTLRRRFFILLIYLVILATAVTFLLLMHFSILF